MIASVTIRQGIATLNEAMLLTYSGRPLEILAVLDSVGETDDPRARALHAARGAPTLVAIGRCEAAAEGAARAFAERASCRIRSRCPRPRCT